MAKARKLKVAAVQVESHNGQVQENLARATPFVAQAAKAGAELVLCPEFLAAGYIYEESIWKSGEPQGGPTEAWLIDQAIAHNIYIGATYLEAQGEEFWNTFTLVAPDGSIAGRVRKESLPAFEGWWFKSCDRDKVIDTPFGRIAVGICQDNHTARFMRRVIDADVDLVLMPHSAPCVPFAAEIMRQDLRDIAPFYANAFGVPVVLVNKAMTKSTTRIPGVPLAKLRFKFPGVSSIVDSDGRVLERLEDEQGVITAEVTLDASRKRTPAPPKHRYWSSPPRRFARVAGAFFMALEYLGKRAYARSARRPLAAREASARPAAVAAERRKLEAV